MPNSDMALTLAGIADEAPDAAHYERGVLGCLQARLDFDVGFFVRGDRVGPGPLNLDGPTLTTTRKAFASYGRELAPVVGEAWRVGVAVDVDVLGRRTLERTQVFRQFMAPHGGRSSLLAPLRFRGKLLGMLVLGRGGQAFSPSEQAALRHLLPALKLADSAHAGAALCAGLSPREREVLQCLCLGYTNAEIACACDVAINTVRNQLQSIYRKLGATNRAEAVALALSA